MSLLAAQGLEKHFGSLVLFREVDFTLSEGGRVGLIGANGTGKTSLFRLILGDPDHDGTLSRKRDLRIAALEQDPRFLPGATVREAMLSADPELADLERRMRDLHERLERGDGETPRLLSRLAEVEAGFEARGGWEVEHRADRILEGIGFPRSRHGALVETLSGGELSRLAFGRMLMVEPDLWLLDEPTNHLDIDGILFLERFLVESKASAILISHDRRFLDRLTMETWELEAERLWRYPGPYSRARMLREERLKSARREFDVQQAWVEKEQEFIRRYGAGQRARQAQGRLKRLERLNRLDRPEVRARVMSLDLSIGEKPGAKILSVRDLAAQVGDRMLFRGLSFDLAPGEVLGIAGPNGAGKTTLLRLLLGELAPAEGTFSWGGRVHRGSLAQHERFDDDSMTPYRLLRESDPRRTEQQLRNLLAAMLFPGDAIERPVSLLSGGERKRLMLTRLLIAGNNVLLLDEPTNHLDLPSREALELALAVWEGTLIVVSHDRYFLDLVADRLLWIEDGETHLTHGGFAEALEKREARRRAARPEPPAVIEPSRPPPRVEVPRTPPSPHARLKTEELEARIIAGEEQARELQESFSRAEVYLQPERLKETQAALAALKEELAALEAEYSRRSK